MEAFDLSPQNGFSLAMFNTSEGEYISSLGLLGVGTAVLTLFFSRQDNTLI